MADPGQIPDADFRLLFSKPMPDKRVLFYNRKRNFPR